MYFQGTTTVLSEVAIIQRASKILINKHLVYRWTHPQTDCLMKSNMSFRTVYIEMFSKQSRTSCKDKILLCTNQHIWREKKYLKLQRLFFIHKLHMSFTLHKNKRMLGKVHVYVY